MPYPLTAAAFLGALPVSDTRFDLIHPRAVTGLNGGEVLTAELAPAYWRGSVTLGAMPKRAAAAIQAQLMALEVPGRTFEAFKAHHIGPASDPLGVSLGAAPVVLEAVRADRAALQLGGLPAGYALAPGDFLAFDYGSGRRALHQLVTGGAAGAASAFSGFATPDMELVPHIRPGVSAGVAVTLLRPACWATLVPGTISTGITQHNVTTGIAFEFRQTLRG